MRDLSRNVPFFIYFERYYGQRKQFCVLTRSWTIEGPNATKEVVRSSHPPLEAITFDHRRKEVIASPFKVVTDRHQPVDKVIEQNNYTNQAIHVIGKQLDRIEDKIENKVILQPGNFSKPVQALEKPLVKLPITRHTSLSHSKDFRPLYNIENNTDFGNKSHRYMNLQQTLGIDTKIRRIGITVK